jgi:hypothetical protein
MRFLFLVVVLISSSFALEAQKKGSSSIIYCGGSADTSEVVNAFFRYGNMDLYQFIDSIMVYPKDSLLNGIKTKINIDFLVDPWGHVLYVSCPDSASFSANLKPLIKEAIRVVVATDYMWVAERHGGKYVTSKLRLPFEIEYE